MNSSQGTAWHGEKIPEFEPHLIRYAFHLLRNSELARDAVQDTFERFLKQSQEKVEANLRAWLFTVCRNRCFDLRKKEKKMQPIDTVQDKPPLATGPSAFSALAKKEDRQTLRQFLLALAEQEQEVVRLKFQSDCSYREISDITGLSQSHVGVTIHRALTKMRIAAKKKGGAQ
ncbi:MAG: sigma-70 family RNA polymerase sigma factor [Myxococcota bacterium]|nr:sigma-70 family RNA polymerase sigma factor [Myxococcota bacterium]